MARTSSRFAKSNSLFIIGLLALPLFTPVIRAQQTIHVPADQPTIQSAINAASNGDTVLVAPGTYIGNINFNGKAITVTSSGGPSVTIIDGGAKGSVVTFTTGETASAVLSGFTIRNGQSDSTTPGFGSGGGILIKGASPTIKSNVITGNHAIDGIGISINDGSPIIQNNTITGNSQCCGSGGGGGGGIHASASSVATSTSPLISGNTITNNSLNGGGFGGGILADYYSTPTIERNLIAGNTAYNSGGGVTLRTYGPVIFVQNVIVNNSSQGGGSGGGLYLQGASYTIVANTIAGNTALDQTSGAFVWVSGPSFAFSSNIVVASAGQTAITCYNANTTFVPTFSHNDVFSTAGQAWSGVCDSTLLPGNISSDPLFMSAANSDFHLKLGSPVIDAGDNTAPNLPATDFDGNPRIVDGNNDGIAAIDMGAYEVVNTSTGSVNPTSLPFGSQAVGTASSPQQAVLSSTGTTPFQITSIQTTSDYTETNSCPIISAPGSAPGVPIGSPCGFTVAFAPTTIGPRAGSLTVNGTNGTSLFVSLSGTGFIPAPVVSLTPANLGFSPQFVGTTSAPQPVTLTNSGNGSLSISSISASQPFALTHNCPTLLAAAANCTINVTFQPIVSGNAAGTLTIVDNAGGSPHTVSLNGTGNPVPQPVAITLIQHASKDAGTTTSSSLAFPSNNGAGNWIAVAIRAGHSGQSFSVKDSNGNTYRQAVQLNVTADAPNGDTLGIFYAENIAGGANQVTVSDTISGTMRIAIFEYSGVASANSLDAIAAAQGSSSAPNSGTIATSANGDLLLGAVLTGNGAVFTAGAGYLVEEHVPAEPNTKLIVEDQVQPASGTASAGASLGASDNWGAAVVAFKSATTSVSTSPTITSLTPNSGGIGASITITGTNFGSTQGPSTVTFNGGAAATATNWSATSIVVPVPTGTTTGNVVVTVGGVASNGVPFTVIVITVSVSPATVTLGTGASQNFVATVQNDAQGNGVTWSLSGPGCSSTACGTIKSNIAAPGEIYIAPATAPSPATATLTATSVTDPTKSAVATITVVQATAPNISSLNPSSGPLSSSVTITGTNFGNSQGSSVVWFSTSAGVVTSWSNTSIVATVPLSLSGNANALVQVVVLGLASNQVNFSITPAPTITSLNPTSGPVGSSVTITGGNFGTTQGTSTVTFNGTLATPISWSATSIAVPVPTGAVTGNVVVAVSGVASNGVAFTVTTQPTITGLSPTSGPAGTSVTISGTGLGATQGTSSVMFGSVTATVTSWSDKSVAAIVPGNLSAFSNVGVDVVVSGVASNTIIFGIAPSITSLNPASGAVGTSVTITGNNFGTSQGTSTVTFNGIATTPTNWSTTSIAVPVPTGVVAGPASVVVTVAGFASNSLNFAVAPVIASLSPSSGPVGTSVTINGTNFGASKGFSSIAFSGIPVSPTSWSDTSIVTSVPSGATTGNVVVTVGSVASNGVSFTVTPSPNITNLSPSVGPVGTSVTISGSNFGASQGTGRVLFNGTPATPTSWSATSIVAPVPTGASTGLVYVVLSGGAVSNGATFTVGPPPPTITSLTPASGPVGTSVTIVGANFGTSQGSSTINFNGTAATPTAWSATSITVPVPAGATTGSVFVTVGGVSNFGVTFTVTTTTANISLVQHTSKDAGTTTSSSLGFNATNAAGNFIAVVIRAGKSGQVFTVSDSRGNLYKQAVIFNMTVDAETLGIFYAENITGGANTITVSDTILGTMRFAILEYSGLATSNSLDVTVAAEGTGVSPGTGNITTTSSGDLLLGEIVTANPATFTAGSGYTIEERAPAEPNTKLVVEDQRQPIAGSASAGASLGISDQWGAVLVAFRHP